MRYSSLAPHNTNEHDTPTTMDTDKVAYKGAGAAAAPPLRGTKLRGISNYHCPPTVTSAYCPADVQAQNNSARAAVLFTTMQRRSFHDEQEYCKSGAWGSRRG